MKIEDVNLLFIPVLSLSLSSHNAYTYMFVDQASSVPRQPE